ncbi:MAG: hypothetical protein ACTSYD_10650 [Candidatus Heimdallarchaeaceae archaeon]
MNDVLLKRIVELLERIDTRLEKLEKHLEGGQKIPTSSLDLLMTIPRSHRQTLFAVQQLGEATCTEVAKITGRSHNLESRYLVRLYELGLLGRRRVPVEEHNKRGTEVRYFIKDGIVGD